MRFGIKIRRFIDKTNINTRIEKRGINLSSFIYGTAKCITLAEMKSTVLENNTPHGSRIKGREIVVELNERSVQEMIKVLLE